MTLARILIFHSFNFKHNMGEHLIIILKAKVFNTLKIFDKLLIR